MDIDVLIGSDYYWKLITGEIRRGDGGPVAFHTRFGWVLSGPTDTTSQITSVTSLVATHTLRVDAEPDTSRDLDNCLRSFWDLESLGICDSEGSVLAEFDNNVRFKDGRYEVSLPWKEYHTPLPTNYDLASKRLQGLLSSLRQDPDTLLEYDRIIKDQISQGIVQTAKASIEGEQKLHYLPHHAVVRRDKNTTKVRIVYDASARSTGPSLNDCLYTGPKFNQKILDILLRFRTHKVPLTADIEKAFLMI